MIQVAGFAFLQIISGHALIVASSHSRTHCRFLPFRDLDNRPDPSGYRNLRELGRSDPFTDSNFEPTANFPEIFS